MIDIPASVIATMQADAALGVAKGDAQDPNNIAYQRHCSHLHWATGSVLTFTRCSDRDYGTGLHLTISFRRTADVDTSLLANVFTVAKLGGTTPMRLFDQELADTWVRLLFEPHHPWAWCNSTHGGQIAMEHWMVQTNRDWEPVPVLPAIGRMLKSLGWRDHPTVLKERKVAA